MVSGQAPSPGRAVLHNSLDHLERSDPGPLRRSCSRPRLLRRYQRSVAILCGTGPVRTSTPTRRWWVLEPPNFAVGFFQGFPISRQFISHACREAAGAKTQVTGVVGALTVSLRPVAAPDLLQNLPSSALAAVVIASAIGLIEIKDLIRIYRVQRWEFWLSILCCTGVAVLGCNPGHRPGRLDCRNRIPVGCVAPALCGVLDVPVFRGYHDITRYPDVRLIPGLVRGMRRCFLPMPRCSKSESRRCSGLADCRGAGGLCGGAGHKCRHHRGGCSGGTGPHACGMQASNSASPN